MRQGELFTRGRTAARPRAPRRPIDSDRRAIEAFLRLHWPDEVPRQGFTQGAHDRARPFRRELAAARESSGARMRAAARLLVALLDADGVRGFPPLRPAELDALERELGA